jgi:ATP-binding cassette, subfamily B, bacterial MsbA
MARFTNDMDSFGQGLNTLMSKLIREPMRFVACLGGALMINWRLTCLALVLVPISGATTYRVGKTMKRAVRRSLESMSTIYKILQESFQGIKVVKAFSNERVERRRFFDETKNLYHKSVRVAMIDAMSDPVLEMLTLTTVVIALLAGSYLVLYHTIYLNLGLFRLQLASEPMAIQDLFTLYTMLAGASDPIRKLANVHSKIQRAAAAADRICALMDRSPKVSPNKRASTLPRHRQSIEFDQVTFAYTQGSPVLRGINLTVHQGETIALVGPNGCGKTTLMNLLPRFGTSKADPFESTATTSVRSSFAASGASSAWSSRRQSCSRTRSPTTSRMETLMPAVPPLSQPPSVPMPISSSWRYRRDTTP